MLAREVHASSARAMAGSSVRIWPGPGHAYAPRASGSSSHDVLAVRVTVPAISG